MSQIAAVKLKPFRNGGLMKAKHEIQNMIFISQNLKIKKLDFYDCQWVQSEKKLLCLERTQKDKKNEPKFSLLAHSV
jgi:hypothetical protein